jgi:hypothetical protein
MHTRHRHDAAMGIRKTWLLRLLGFALVFLARITTRAQVPPDVVHLQDGTFLRGTIVERSPTQLVLMLPTGEVRTYPTEVLATVEVGEQPSDVATTTRGVRCAMHLARPTSCRARDASA